MEIALVHNNSLILGPMGFNVRYINSELENLEIEERISPQSYVNLPIHFSDNLTHLLPLEKNVPNHDLKYQNIGNFSWEVIKENNVPVKVLLNYSIVDKPVEDVKEFFKREVSSIRKEKENKNILITINDVQIETSTSREERILLSSKLSSSVGSYNFKFKNSWLEITPQELQYILSEIDKVVQSAFDWELSKFQEIDACKTIDDVYNVKIREIEQNHNIIVE
jgi:hypothetical protein